MAPTHDLLDSETASLETKFSKKKNDYQKHEIYPISSLIAHP
jgi:hypothetical protein